MSTLNVAVADEKKNMQSLLKGMEQRQDGYDRLHVWIHCKLW